MTWTTTKTTTTTTTRTMTPHDDDDEDGGGVEDEDEGEDHEGEGKRRGPRGIGRAAAFPNGGSFIRPPDRMAGRAISPALRVSEMFLRFRPGRGTFRAPGPPRIEAKAAGEEQEDNED